MESKLISCGKTKKKKEIRHLQHTSFYNLDHKTIHPLQVDITSSNKIKLLRRNRFIHVKPHQPQLIDQITLKFEPG